MLAGLTAAIDPAQITAVVNTGDDTVIHGLHVCPDLDTVTYTLAGAINSETGWGLQDETWEAMSELRALSGGRLGWFNLGDRDLGTHLYRTSRLAEGATYSEVAAEIAARWSVRVRLLPMSDQPVRTKVVIDDGSPAGSEVDFQEYFVKQRHQVAVRGVRLSGAEDAKAAPGVIDAIEASEAVVICPSNPIVSIGPVLATGGIGDAVAARRESTIAVSPIVAGRALKGPADRMLRELGCEPSAVGVARLWAPYAATLVIDDSDALLAGRVEEEGMKAVVYPTVMAGRTEAANLAREVLRHSAGLTTGISRAGRFDAASAPTSASVSLGRFDGSWPR